MGNIDNNEFKKLENLYKLKEFSKLEKEVKRLLKIDNKNLFLKNILGVICLKKILKWSRKYFYRYTKK